MHGGMRRPVVHRDIKPANVLLNVEGRGREAVITQAVITDFGFACVEKSDDTIPGTVRYMSPEALIGESPCGRPGDIWALGVTLMEIWSGKKPLGEIGDEAIERSLCHDYRPPEKLGILWEGGQGWQGEKELGGLKSLRQLLKPCFGEEKARPDAAALKAAFRPPPKVGLI